MQKFAINNSPLVTVFTPSYNRAHTLPRLYASLLQQGCVDTFEWLIIDDHSSDATAQIVKKWIEEGKININYIRLEKNVGKPRAINIAVEKARSKYLFIVDSDDYLVSGIIPKIIRSLMDVADSPDVNGVGVLRQHSDGTCFANPTFESYVDATNLQRGLYGLDVDCNEVYKISVLKNYPFKVWEGETFTPEAIVLNAMALDGYKIRWLNEPGVISEYQEDGLTKGSWRLQHRNPMGYAMLFNSKLRYQHGFRQRFYAAVQMTTQCFLGKQLSYLRESNAPMLTLISIPVAIVMYIRRLWQYRSVL